ncbi:hypothetical protein D3C75_881090 [compost metagenome]
MSAPLACNWLGPLCSARAGMVHSILSLPLRAPLSASGYWLSLPSTLSSGRASCQWPASSSSKRLAILPASVPLISGTSSAGLIPLNSVVPCHWTPLRQASLPSSLSSPFRAPSSNFIWLSCSRSPLPESASLKGGTSVPLPAVSSAN